MLQGEESQTQKKISKRQLINKLNYINFQDEPITINFKHKRYGQLLACLAKPQPCLGEDLNCRWTEPFELHGRLHAYEFESLQIKDSRLNLLLKPELVDIDKTGIRFRIPEIYYQLISAKSKREPCKDIQAQLVQNSVLFKGVLLDFCATSFRVQITLEPPQTSQWINATSSVDILLSGKDEVLYSGECNILSEMSTGSTITFLVEPTNRQIQRFKPKKFRSFREDITPSPTILFRHPFTKQLHDLRVIDLSGSGFSVEEDEHALSLPPGLILPEVEMRFADSLKIRLKAQVVYRNTVDSEKDGRVIKCGLAIIDIISQDHLKLLSTLLQLKNRNAYVCNEIDIDALWNFFFESGFIYPEKYHYVQENKDTIKETYEKIYTQSPSIARHFVYQNKGAIAGHLAMIRFYENTWLIHHHAARTPASFKAGLVVLDQIGQFSNNSHNLYSGHMNFLICYFRPENKFPNRVFGGAARAINDPHKCCIEPFAYFHHHADQEGLNAHFEIPWNWSLNDADAADIEELDAFYACNSGGLMLKALDLEQGLSTTNGLESEYQKLGLKRERYIFSLKSDEELIAVVMVNVSNMGLNLSDLTSSAQVIVLDSDALPKKVLNTALSLISIRLQLDNFPVLIYPVAYTQNQSIAYEKIYNLWILNTQFGDNYFRYVNRLTRLV